MQGICGSTRFGFHRKEKARPGKYNQDWALQMISEDLEIPGGPGDKESTCNTRGDIMRLGFQVRKVLGQEEPLEKAMATHSSILAWRILWTEEPGELQSIGLQSQK